MQKEMANKEDVDWVIKILSGRHQGGVEKWFEVLKENDIKFRDIVELILTTWQGGNPCNCDKCHKALATATPNIVQSVVLRLKKFSKKDIHKIAKIVEEECLQSLTLTTEKDKEGFYASPEEPKYH